MNTTDFPQFEEPWLFRGVPALVAHRGYAHCYPENTLKGLEEAVNAGAKYIEFDVQLSKDQIPFLFHDDDLLRTAGLDLSVFDAEMSKLEKISVGEEQRFGDRFLSATPIRLVDLCEQLNEWPDVHFFIEVKQQSIDRFGLEKVADQVLAAISTLTSSHTIISFNIDLISHLQAISDKSTGWVLSLWDQSSLETMQRMAMDFVFCDYRKVSKVELLPQLGSSWVLYEIDTPEKLAHCRTMGADLIETMMVESMLEKIG